MRQFVQIVDEIDESKRLILGGSLSQLRMALLLLDNAVELIAERAIQSELRHSDVMNRIFRSLSDMPPGDAKVDELKEKARQDLIEPDRRKRLKRYFDEKFLFLGERQRLEEPIPRVLSAIHR